MYLVDFFLLDAEGRRYLSRILVVGHIYMQEDGVVEGVCVYVCVCDINQEVEFSYKSGLVTILYCGSLW